MLQTTLVAPPPPTTRTAQLQLLNVATRMPSNQIDHVVDAVGSFVADLMTLQFNPRVRSLNPADAANPFKPKTLLDLFLNDNSLLLRKGVGEAVHERRLVNRANAELDARVERFTKHGFDTMKFLDILGDALLNYGKNDNVDFYVTATLNSERKSIYFASVVLHQNGDVTRACDGLGPTQPNFKLAYEPIYLRSFCRTLEDVLTPIVAKWVETCFTIVTNTFNLYAPSAGKYAVEDAARVASTKTQLTALLAKHIALAGTYVTSDASPLEVGDEQPSTLRDETLRALLSEQTDASTTKRTAAIRKREVEAMECVAALFAPKVKAAVDVLLNGFDAVMEAIRRPVRALRVLKEFAKLDLKLERLAPLRDLAENGFVLMLTIQIDAWRSAVGPKTIARAFELASEALHFCKHVHVQTSGFLPSLGPARPPMPTWTSLEVAVDALNEVLEQRTRQRPSPLPMPRAAETCCRVISMVYEILAFTPTAHAFFQRGRVCRWLLESTLETLRVANMHALDDLKTHWGTRYALTTNLRTARTTLLDLNGTDVETPVRAASTVLAHASFDEVRAVASEDAQMLFANVKHRIVDAAAMRLPPRVRDAALGRLSHLTGHVLDLALPVLAAMRMELGMYATGTMVSRAAATLAAVPRVARHVRSGARGELILTSDDVAGVAGVDALLRRLAEARWSGVRHGRREGAAVASLGLGKRRVFTLADPRRLLTTIGDDDDDATMSQTITN
jgi:hypothetical protein